MSNPFLRLFSKPVPSALPSASPSAQPSPSPSKSPSKSPSEQPSTTPYDCGADCRTLLTTFDANTSGKGNIFKVQAVQDIVITGFTIHTTNAGSGTVKIWDRTGDYVGSEGDPEAWNLIMNEGFTGAGFGQQTPLADLGVPILILAGTFRSFYVYSSLGVQYTNGSVEGSIYSTNAGEIIFYEGKGTAGEIGAVTYAPRVWNGIIQYGLATDIVTVPISPAVPLPS